MKKIYKLLIVLSLFSGSAVAQSNFCTISISPNDTSLCLGDSVFITAEAFLVDDNNAFDFNSGTPPTGWDTGGNSTVGQPCLPSPDGTPYYWAASAGNATPQITTNSLDVSCGGEIIFDFVMSVQNDPSPCEGPDQADEGVELQYSIDGGVTWNSIAYFQPDGQILPAQGTGSFTGVNSGQQTPFTTWDTYTFPIPAGAIGPNTIFQWIQPGTSGDAFDNWGLDNIIINASAPPCNQQTTVVNWNTGLMDTTEFWIKPVGDTILTAFVFDTLGNLQCEASIDVTIFANDMTYDLIDTVVSPCPGLGVDVEVLNAMSSSSPNSTGFSYDWSVPGVTNPITLPAGILEQEEIWYDVTISDFCYEKEDSVLLIVNKTLNIDTMFTQASNACNPSGSVSAEVIGETNLIGPSNYTWSGPGANSPNSIDSISWNNLSSGWYYFTVEDDVCDDFDSVFVDVLDAPIAVANADVVVGCNPLTVNFTNESINTNEYQWSFGNDNIVNTTDLSSQSFTFTESTSVQLIAFSTPDCSNSITIPINIVTCGCKDPQATNYLASAVIDDGSCIYPVSIVNVPNVFSPNGDIANEVFKLEFTNAKAITLTILNRWGNIVFEEKSADPQWNGLDRNNGNPVADGTYFYKYVAEGIDGLETEGQGFITVFGK